MCKNAVRKHPYTVFFQFATTEFISLTYILGDSSMLETTVPEVLNVYD